MSRSITRTLALVGLGASVAVIAATPLATLAALDPRGESMPGMEADHGATAAPSNHPAGHASHTMQMPGMQMPGMSMGGSMPSSIDLADPMSRESSGTAWIPDSSPMYGKMTMRGGNMLMLHGAVFPRYIDVGSKRGDRRIDVTSWFMGMSSHPLGQRS